MALKSRDEYRHDKPDDGKAPKGIVQAMMKLLGRQTMNESCNRQLGECHAEHEKNCCSILALPEVSLGIPGDSLLRPLKQFVFVPYPKTSMVSQSHLYSG
jgi:hypothetical protein